MEYHNKKNILKELLFELFIILAILTAAF